MLLTHAAAVDGFFAVYFGVFKELDEQEKTAKGGDVPRPTFGSSGSDATAVAAFYSYWLSFATCRSDRAFAKHDKWDLSDAPSPVMRRLMRQKNMAVRDKARAMFNDKASPQPNSRAARRPRTVTRLLPARHPPVARRDAPKLAGRSPPAGSPMISHYLLPDLPCCAPLACAARCAAWLRG